MMFSNVISVVAGETEKSKIRNIIYMIPDGGGMEPFYLSDALKQAGGWNRDVFPNSTEAQKGDMYAKQYLVGAVTTYSANADITDSAAAGTALSSGYKTKNGYIGMTPEKLPKANLLEAAQYVGKNTGMVTTYEWTNATPAAFSAHEKDRGNYAPMSEQIVNKGIDVVLGVGFGAYKLPPKLDFERIKTIANIVDVPLVLHGGSGLTDDEIELVKEQIKQYKEICEVVHKGEMYRLRSPYEVRNTSWEFVFEDTVVLMYYTIFARNMLGKTRVKLSGLEENAYYVEKDTQKRYTGSYLMNVGLYFESKLLIFKKQ